jgi:hypothetical protein
MHAVTEDQPDAVPPPTAEELSDGIVRLLTEVADILASDRWAILDRGSEHVTWLLYDAAACVTAAACSTSWRSLPRLARNWLPACLPGPTWKPGSLASTFIMAASRPLNA